MATQTIKLKSIDNQIFEVNLRSARLSQKLTEMLDSNGITGEAISMDDQHITGDILRRVLEWCDYHQNDSASDLVDSESDEEYEQWTMQQRRNQVLFQKQRRKRKPLGKFDRKFFQQQDNSSLYGIIICAHYMKIKKLRNIACGAVANRLKNMNPQELRAEFSLPEDQLGAVPDDDDIKLLDISSRRG